MTRLAVPAAILLLVLSGCKTSPASTLHQPARGYVYDTTAESGINQRAADLQKQGYTQDGAMGKAKTEAAGKAWQPETNEAENWAYEQSRRARSDANEKMEKDLAKLDK